MAHARHLQNQDDFNGVDPNDTGSEAADRIDYNMVLGYVVTLNCGGPPMTIVAVGRIGSADAAKCVWFDTTHVAHERVFPFHSISFLDGPPQPADEDDADDALDAQSATATERRAVQ